MAPVASDDYYTTPFNTSLVVPAQGILSNDTDSNAGQTLTAVIVTQPSHGTVTVNPDGSIRYTPSSGLSGEDSYTYRAFDGSNYSNEATVHITVTPGM